ncbi:268_t:CDS:10 [Ambispora gerdemannii]|uniref:Mitochondrial import inner membrane translocase subunit Tim21 n=1 Tax=Ambispora gerdemannii TaxID=144530 RepID=A0A9N8YXE7_9GLOM|nr:268_t:CDS:10 [Ambispora gerdemannii]
MSSIHHISRTNFRSLQLLRKRTFFTSCNGETHKLKNIIRPSSLFFKRKNRYLNTSTREPARKSIVESDKTTEWSDLTPGQKVAGGAKATINLGIVAIGVGIFGTLVYLLFSELFGSNSSTKIFGEALEKIRANSECQQLLGVPIKRVYTFLISKKFLNILYNDYYLIRTYRPLGLLNGGHGEPSSHPRQRRHRDTDGTEHRLMKFYVEGPENEGVAILDMIKNQQEKWFQQKAYEEGKGYLLNIMLTVVTTLRRQRIPKSNDLIGLKNQAQIDI